MPKILVNNINLYYEIRGNKGEFLVLIAGLTRDHTIWRKIIHQFSQKYRVLVFDNRGAGQSDKPDTDYTIHLMANDFLHLINALKIEKTHILGHSMGAFIAMDFAANFPKRVSKLVLASACAKQVDTGMAYLKNRIAVVQDTLSTETDIRNAMPWLYGEEFLNDPEKVSNLIQYEVANLHPQPSYAFKRQAAACIQHDAREILNRITAPTLIISGAEDKIITPVVSKELQTFIPQAKLEIVPGAAHMMQIETNSFFVNKIENFLKN